MGAAKSCYKRDGHVCTKGTHKPPQSLYQLRVATLKSSLLKSGKPGDCHNNRQCSQQSAQDAQVLPPSCLRPSRSTTASESSITLLEQMQHAEALAETSGAQDEDCVLECGRTHREQEQTAQDWDNRRSRSPTVPTDRATRPRRPKMGSTRSRSPALAAALIESHENNRSTRLRRAHTRPDVAVDDDALLAARLASLEDVDQRALEETANQDAALAATSFESQGNILSSCLRRVHTRPDAAVDDDALLAARLASLEDADQRALEETANQDAALAEALLADELSSRNFFTLR